MQVCWETSQPRILVVDLFQRRILIPIRERRKSEEEITLKTESVGKKRFTTLFLFSLKTLQTRWNSTTRLYVPCGTLFEGWPTDHKWMLGSNSTNFRIHRVLCASKSQTTKHMYGVLSASAV